MNRSAMVSAPITSLHAIQDVFEQADSRLATVPARRECCPARQQDVQQRRSAFLLYKDRVLCVHKVGADEILSEGKVQRLRRTKSVLSVPRHWSSCIPDHPKNQEPLPQPATQRADAGLGIGLAPSSPDRTCRAAESVSAWPAVEKKRG